jgi:hypothetical protein
VSGLLRDPVFRRALGRGAFVSVILLGLLVFRAPYFDLAIRLWLVALAAICVWAVSARSLSGWTRAADPGRPLDWRWRRAPAQLERVRGLEELEHAVEFSQTTAFDFHYRLRPHLVRVAAHRLSGQGVELESQPERARQILGEEAWELVRPDRPPPERRNDRGLELARLRRLVERLDAL